MAVLGIVSLDFQVGVSPGASAVTSEDKWLFPFFSILGELRLELGLEVEYMGAGLPISRLFVYENTDSTVSNHEHTGVLAISVEL